MKIDTHHVPESAHGWKDVWAPSAIPFNELYPTPIEMSLEQIEELKRGFVASTKLSKQAGYDVIEIHNAHGSVERSIDNADALAICCTTSSARPRTSGPTSTEARWRTCVSFASLSC